MGQTVTERRKILLIDDEHDLREALRIRLTASGFDVTAVDSGDAGLKEAGANRFDLILLDMLMPGKSGIVTLQELRAQPASRQIPVILLTAVTTQEHWEPMPHSTGGGPAFIMGKPYDRDILLNRIQQVLTGIPEGPSQTGGAAG